MTAESTPQNSRLRLVVSKPTQTIARVLLRIPGLDADHITIAGTVGVLGSALVHMVDERKEQPSSHHRVHALFGYAVFSLFDMLDGAVARQQMVQGSQRDTSRGAITDTLADRIQEAGLVLIRMVEARQRGDTIGLFAATAVGLSNLGPSLVRALAESKGKTVKENSRGLGILGTRAGRVVTGGTATFFPRTQPVLDMISTVANVATTIERAHVVRDTSIPPVLPDKKVKEAKKRLQALGVFAAVAVPTLVVANRLFSKKK